MTECDLLFKSTKTSSLFNHTAKSAEMRSNLLLAAISTLVSKKEQDRLYILVRGLVDAASCREPGVHKRSTFRFILCGKAKASTAGRSP
jgi:hypothetical protein